MEKISFPKIEEKKVLGILTKEGLITTTRSAKDFFRLKLNHKYLFRNMAVKIVKRKWQNCIYYA